MEVGDKILLLYGKPPSYNVISYAIVSITPNHVSWNKVFKNSTSFHTCKWESNFGMRKEKKYQSRHSLGEWEKKNHLSFSNSNQS